MCAHNAAVVRERLGRRWRKGHGYDDRLYRRRRLVIGCETTTMHVPTLNWPTDLFVDCQTPKPEVTT